MGAIRWGILGAAKFAREHMGPAIANARGAELVALATRDPENAGPFREFAPGLRVHTSYDDLLADPEIDAVYVPLPNDMHTPWAIKALDAGKHVLVEKPVSMTVAEVDQLIAARDASGLVAAEAYMITHHPQWHKLRELLNSGELGRLRRVDGVFSYDNRADAGNIRNQASKGGGGIRDIGVYPFGAVRFVTGQEPVRITDTHLEMENDVDVRAHVTAEFADFSFSALVSMRMALWQMMEFHGEKAVARLTAPFNPGVFGEARLEIYKSDQSCEVFRWPTVNQYVLQVEAFGRAIGGEDYVCPLEFSRGTQVMIDSILG